MSKTNRRAYKVASAGCVVYRKRNQTVEFLLARREDSPWMLPRGKMLQDERPRTAAVREVFEETGVKVRATIEVGAYSYPIGKGRYKHVQFYAATALSGTPTPDGREFSEVSWLSFQDAIAGVSSRDAVLIETVESMCRDKVLW